MAKKNKVVKQRETASNSKSPKHIEDPESFYEKIPVWSFKLLDNILILVNEITKSLKSVKSY